MQTNKSFQL